MDRIHDLIREIDKENKSQESLREAMKRQSKKEKSGSYKWVVIGKQSKLHLLCKVDKDGKLIPKELERIKRVKQVLNIKEDE